MNSLTLMSALALALVYGLGGVLAIGGHLQTGAIVVVGPAADPAVRAADGAGQRARRNRQCAGQFRARLRGARPRAADPGEARRRAGARRARSVEFDDVRFSYPSADKVSLASLEEVAVLGRPRGRRSAARHFVHRRAGRDGGAGRFVGRGQVDDRVVDGPALRRRLRRGPAQRRRRARRDVRVAEGDRRHGHPGRSPVPRVDPRRICGWPRRARPTTSCGRRWDAPGWPTSSARCPTVWTPSSASAATGSPAASASG